MLFGSRSLMLSPPGRDVFFAEEKLEMGRNFMNKIWQASRMILSAYDKDGEGLVGDRPRGEGPLADMWSERYGRPLAAPLDLQWEDRWILSALHAASRDVTDRLSGSRLNDAASRVYDFFWSDFCDWYLEMAKIRLYGEGDKRTVLAVLLFTLGESVKMLHPFMPYVTEELWSRFPNDRRPPRRNAKYPRVVLMHSVMKRLIRGWRCFGGSSRRRGTSELSTASPQRPSIELRIKTPEPAPRMLDEMTAGIKQLTRERSFCRSVPMSSRTRAPRARRWASWRSLFRWPGSPTSTPKTQRLEKEKVKIERELAAR